MKLVPQACAAPHARDAARSATNSFALLIAVGSVLGVISLGLDLTQDDNRALVLGLCAIGLPVAIVLTRLPRSIPPGFFAAVGVPVLLIHLAVAFYLGGVASNPASAFYPPIMLYSFYFFPRRVAYAHLALATAGFGGALLLITAPAEAFDRVLFTIGMAVLTGEVVAFLRDRLKAQATRDWLTGLLNRRGFDEDLDRVLARAGGPVAVLLVDVNDFKHVNDTAGHAAGDDALRGIARILRESSPRDAKVARIGGDEFALVLPSGGEPAAHACAAAVRARMTGDLPGVSIGMAATPDDGSSPDDLVRAADRALYAAKRTRPGLVTNDAAAGPPGELVRAASS